MLTHTRNQRLDSVSSEVISRQSGLIGNYRIVSKPGTPLWPYRRTCSLLVAERGLKTTGPAKVGSVLVNDIPMKANVLETICGGKRNAKIRKCYQKGQKKKKKKLKWKLTSCFNNSS